MQILIKPLLHHEGLPFPAYMSKDSSGMDLSAAVQHAVTILPGQRVLIPTGLIIQIPTGYEGQIRSRSGLALRRGVTVLNSPGTIDSDYRGEVQIVLANLGEEPFVVERGDRIAQLVIAPVCQASVKIAADLDVTIRSEGGFGHTGV